MIPTKFIRCCLSLLLGLAMSCAWADGTLTHMSGPVSILKADGKTIPGTPGAKALVGDTVITGANGFVRMEMTDGGEIVLRPESQLKIEAYKFNEAKPADDSFAFKMVKGGLRTVTGLIGKRGNKDAYELKTETATIGIRGTQFDLRVCQGNCGALANGTYLAVRFGAVQTTNALGTLPVAAGQAAFVPPSAPPVMLPRDPGIGFTPPAVIPKLDEKKKQQTAAPAAEQKPGAQGQSSQQGQSQSGQGGAKTDSKGDSGKGDSSGKGDAGGKADTSGKGDSGGKTDSAPKSDSGAGKDSGQSQGGASSQASSGSSGQQGGSATSGQSSAPTQQQSVAPAASPTAPAAGGDCSIQ